MNTTLLLSDLHVFLVVTRNKSFIAAANELGKSPAFISKRIQYLEQHIGCRLLVRSTRHVGLTEEGKKVYEKAAQLLTDTDLLLESIKSTQQQPSGSLHMTTSLGFGRQHIAPIVAHLATQYPLLNIRLDTNDKLYDLIEHGIDLDIHIGNEIAPNLIAQRLYPNHRVLCASPSYLAKKGTPKKLSDLLHHNCLIIKERDHPFGLWKLSSPQGGVSIKVNGTLASNNGDLVKIWALSGLGVMLRSLWDIQTEIAQGQLTHILPDYKQEADIWAVYPTRLSRSSNLKACIQVISEHLVKRLSAPLSNT